MTSSTLEHFSHPEHLLVLKEDDIIAENAKCYVCNISVIGSPTYTCSSDDISCRNFYLHKTCAELPKQINHHKHTLHPLVLQRRKHCFCDVCSRRRSLFNYTCDDCYFYVCVFCAFEQRVLRHPGHHEHSLTLMRREALFRCDACGEKASDSSYSCNPCEFWIHKTCALSPFIIAAPTYHHHPLNLIYSIPEMHRYFVRYCVICQNIIPNYNWLYYCHKCTYFVHMKCATSPYTVSIATEIEANGVDNDPDLVQFPLPSDESLFQVIVTQCCKLQVDFHCEHDGTLAKSTIPDDPRMIEEHWSHKNHPLEQLQLPISENDDDRCDDDDKRLLICDGCIQPITNLHRCYYACIQCGFFLHSFCATELPRELPAGASPFHPQHSLLLNQKNKFYRFAYCEICSQCTNGFYYECKICDIEIDVRCAFLPTRIRHKSHKYHSLVQRRIAHAVCSVSGHGITFGNLVYACETCSNFQISLDCLFYPSRMKHRYDDHSLILRYPPFFYEGVFYCEICEEQVNNQYWLYHCGECDHSFHCGCLRSYRNVKLGGTIKHSIGYQQHTLALVLKRILGKKCPPYFCGICGRGYRYEFFFECDGCGYLACIYCIREKYGE